MSEPHGNVEEDAPGRRIRTDVQIVAHRRAAEVRHLGIEAAVWGPHEEIAGRDTDGHGVRAEVHPFEEVRRHIEVQRNLADLHEARVLDVRSDDAVEIPGVAGLPRIRSPVSRRLAVVHEELRQVDDITAVLPVDHRGQGRRPVAEGVDEADPEVGRRVSELRQRVGARLSSVALPVEADELRDRPSLLNEGATQVAEAGLRGEERRQSGQIDDVAGVARERDL